MMVSAAVSPEAPSRNRAERASGRLAVPGLGQASAHRCPAQAPPGASREVSAISKPLTGGDAVQGVGRAGGSQKQPAQAGLAAAPCKDSFGRTAPGATTRLGADVGTRGVPAGGRPPGRGTRPLAAPPPRHPAPPLEYKSRHEACRGLAQPHRRRASRRLRCRRGTEQQSGRSSHVHQHPHRRASPPSSLPRTEHHLALNSPAS
jgi:hypothetical protein